MEPAVGVWLGGRVWAARVGGLIQHPGQRLSARARVPPPASLGGSRPPSAHGSAPQSPVPAAGLSVAPPAGWGRAAPSIWAGDAQPVWYSNGHAARRRARRTAGAEAGSEERAPGSAPPRSSRALRLSCGGNPRLEPAEMQMSPGLLDCLVFSGPQFTRPKLSTGEPSDSEIGEPPDGSPE